jgi:hypothetical protein
MHGKAIRPVITVLGAPILLAIATMAHVSLRGAQAQGQQLVGTWTVTPVQDSQPQPPSIVIFHADGTLTNINANRSLTTGGGEWVRGVGERQFSLMFAQFAHDAQGQLVGVSRIRANLEINPENNSLGGRYQNDVFDASGAFVLSTQGMVAGNRVPLEPL